MIISVTRRLTILYIMFKIIAARPIREGWHLTHMLKALAWPHHFTMTGDLVP
jgi:hypothetical protein